VLAEQGVVQVFHKVAIRPGKPLWFGIRDTPNQVTLVFGLPGNPVSSFVCCELFVRPAIAALSGKGFLGLRPATAKLARAHSHSGGRVAYLPARYSRAEPERAATVEILPWHGSGDLAALASANALARMAETAELGPGDTVDVLII
jgi:molybdopterin molybdotransferase